VVLEGKLSVIATESHNEALSLARAEHFDLYLIGNWICPGISGVRLCEQLRGSLTSTHPFSSFRHAYESDKQRALSSGRRVTMVNRLTATNCSGGVAPNL